MVVRIADDHAAIAARLRELEAERRGDEALWLVARDPLTEGEKSALRDAPRGPLVEKEPLEPAVSKMSLIERLLRDTARDLGRKEDVSPYWPGGPAVSPYQNVYDAIRAKQQQRPLSLPKMWLEPPMSMEHRLVFLRSGEWPQKLRSG
jgi:hypothetical protein